MSAFPIVTIGTHSRNEVSQQDELVAWGGRGDVGHSSQEHRVPRRRRMRRGGGGGVFVDLFSFMFSSFLGNSMKDRTTENQATSPGVLQASQIPERLQDTTTWNCSVPHWPRFRRHFRCNLRQDCASGEDEVQCPYSPCEHGGVSFQDQCYFFMENYNNVSWGLAQVECRKVGAYLASLTTHREWTDVMNWLHLGVP